jgi:DNA-binding transcriptional ArsR family regulator
MSVVPPIIVKLARDERLAARDVQVWLIVADQLLAAEYRELIPADVAQSLKLTRPVASAALKSLTDCGYLECGGRSRPNGPMLYRLPVEFAPRQPPATGAAATAPPPKGRRMYSSGVV